MPRLAQSLLLVALAAAPVQAFAADPPENEVIVEGRSTDRAASEGRAGSKVAKRDLDEGLPRSAPDALRYEPGVYVQQTAHGQGSPFVRGRTGQQVLLLFDGVRLNNSTYRQGPNQYFFTVDARTIHAIEVMRGGGSTMYGSDALAGVIDARPIEPALDASAEGPVLRPRVAVRGATADGELGFRHQMDVQWTKGLRVLAGVGSRRVGLLESGGAVCSPGATNCTPESEAAALVPAFADDGRTQLGTGFREATADARVTAQLTPGLRAIAAAYVYRQLDAPRTDQCPPPFASQRECLIYDEQFRTLAYVALRGEGPPLARSIDATLSFQRQHERRTRSRPQSFVENGGRDDVNTIGAAAKLTAARLDLAPWASLTLRYGGDAYFDSIESRAWTEFTDVDVVIPLSRGQYLAGSTYAQGGAFVDAETELFESVTVRAGARGGVARADAPEDVESGTLAVSETWPLVAAHGGVEARPAEGLSVIANVDRSFRAPNLDDLTSRQQAGPGFQLENPALAPEGATTLEAGVRADVSFVQADAWIYQSILDDAIVRATRDVAACPPGTPQCNASWSRYQLVNLQSPATITGAEASLRLWLPAALTLRATVAYARGSGPNPQDPEAEEVPLSRIPPLHGSADLRWRSPHGLYAGAALRWATTQDRLAISDRSDARIPAGGTPGFGVVDLRGGFRYGRHAVVSLVVENVGDTAYRHHGSSIQGPGRGAVIQVEAGL